ncbi:HAMP domain-containing histidine kinase [Pseudoclavibacter chungangensis]|uniref:histidine kinase n=1 Tax=Pseudoclavibacter chungangensis TaxID=587635 RepID=A0A7J5C1N0_9MICO|nr:HAMP domain-containing sensor histidine kinase [Pseudoclavibacter chungangensis]KAB1662531.1 HAMP domain-containing histidine kinase [Pseudoclavibacter chungangensis]NYJ68570.1 two-component system sensor histidine kinase MtrB [Pseudoclavibacter chungangensis]
MTDASPPDTRRRGGTISRFVITWLLLGATVVTLATSAGIVLAARATIYETAQDALIDDFARTTDIAFDELSVQQDDDSWLVRTGWFAGPATFVDLGTGRAVGDLTLDDVPGALRPVVGGTADGEAISFERGHLDGHEVFFMAVERDMSADVGGSRIAIVTAHPLDEPLAKVLALVRTGVADTLGALLVLGTAGILLARRIGRPVESLATMAQSIARGTVPDAPPPSGFAELDGIGRTLHDGAVRQAHTTARLLADEARARRFVSDAAHELRTPLTAMTAALDVLDPDDSATDAPGAPGTPAPVTPAQRDAAVAVLGRSTERMRGLVASLLELARLDARVTGVTVSDVSVAALVGDAVSLVASATPIEVSGDAGLRAWTDAERLRTIVSNLVANAVRHGAPPVRVDVARAPGDAFAVRVHDEGGGIPPELRERVFERFAMVDGSRSATGGTGLGLAIAQESARLIGGRLRVVDDGPGCTFELLAPVTLTAPTGPEDGERATPGGA